MPTSTKTKPSTKSTAPNDSEASANDDEGAEATNQNGTKQTRASATRKMVAVSGLPTQPKRKSGNFTPQLQKMVKEVLEGDEGQWYEVTEYVNETGARNAQKDHFDLRIPAVNEDGSPKIHKKSGSQQETSPHYDRKTGISVADSSKLDAMKVEVPEGVTVWTAAVRQEKDGKLVSSLYLGWTK